MNIRFNKTERHEILEYLCGTRFGLTGDPDQFARLKKSLCGGTPLHVDTVAPAIAKLLPSEEEYRLLTSAVTAEWHKAVKLPFSYATWGDYWNRNTARPLNPHGDAWCQTREPIFLRVTPANAGKSSPAAEHPRGEMVETLPVMERRRGDVWGMIVTGLAPGNPYYFVPKRPPARDRNRASPGFPVLTLPGKDWVRRLVIKHTDNPESLSEGLFERLRAATRVLQVHSTLRFCTFSWVPKESSEYPYDVWTCAAHTPSLGYVSLYFPEMIPHLPPGLLRKIRKELATEKGDPVKWRVGDTTPPPPPRLREAMRLLNAAAGLTPGAAKPLSKRTNKRKKPV